MAKKSAPASLLNIRVAPREPEPSGPRAGAGPPDIADWWRRACGERPWPALGDIDGKQVAYYWPHSLLLRRTGDDDGLEIETVFSAGRGGRTSIGDSGPLASDESSMLAAWVLGMARKALRRGAEVDTTESFPLPGGWRSYRGVALPLGDERTGVDHVLCYVQPAD